MGKGERNGRSGGKLKRVEKRREGMGMQGVNEYGIRKRVRIKGKEERS